MAGEQTAPGVRRSRNALDAEAEITIADRATRAEVLDVSLSGLRTRRPEGLAAHEGAQVQLLFPLDAADPLLLGATLVRSADGELAFRFAPPSQLQEDALRALIRRRGQLRDSTEEDG